MFITIGAPGGGRLSQNSRREKNFAPGFDVARFQQVAGQIWWCKNES
jgi:hypothetical protein